jgi:hypothetical protein
VVCGILVLGSGGIEPRRIGPVVRALRRQTDPLFRQAGIDLDEG